MAQNPGKVHGHLSFGYQIWTTCGPDPSVLSVRGLCGPSPDRASVAVWSAVLNGAVVFFGAWPGRAFWQHLRPPAPYHPGSVHPIQAPRWRPPSGMAGTPASQ